MSNPVAKMDRPPHRSEPPTQVPSGTLMDALIDAARRRQRPRDMAIFLILRYSGMRRESVATLRVRHLDETWGLRGVLVKGGRTRDIPLPRAVMEFLWAYVEQVLEPTGVSARCGHAVVLVHVGTARHRQDAATHDGEEHLAAVQGIWPDDRRADVEAA